MTMQFKSTFIALAVAALPGVAFAQSPSDKAGARIDQRQIDQQRRINQGVQSGELTRREAERLQADQARIKQMEDRARADGKITKKEAREIERAQDRQSQAIYREKHDQQKVHPTPARSNPAGAHIDQRQAEQQRRIDQGVKSGQLTPQEAARLQKGQDRVQRMEDQARADGKITRREAAEIERAQDRQSA